ncbi:MAG TPA: hypothetical protein VF862_05215 [Gemmatimonadales bacterium]
MDRHDRAAAFTGSDGQPYSVGILSDDDPDPRGLYGAALLFVRWDRAGDRPVGHVETGYLAWGATVAEAEARVRALSLYDVKAALDEAIATRPDAW